MSRYPARRRRQQMTVDLLLECRGRLFSQDLGIDLAGGDASSLFRWLCAALLMSARIRTVVAMQAARAIFAAGWTSPAELRASRWEDRVAVLNGAGYGRYDESTARYLGETAALICETYHGDLTALRAAAGRSASEERRLLKACKGIGDVGVDIFFREAQIPWGEIYPFADRKALEAAEELGLPCSAAGLACFAPRERLAPLVAALVRVGLAGETEDLRARSERVDGRG